MGIYNLSDNIRFEIISDTQNTSNHYISHESNFSFVFAHSLLL